MAHAWAPNLVCLCVPLTHIWTSTDGLFDCLYLSPSALPVKTSGFLPPYPELPSLPSAPLSPPRALELTPNANTMSVIPTLGLQLLLKLLGVKREFLYWLSDAQYLGREDGRCLSNMDKGGFYFLRMQIAGMIRGTSNQKGPPRQPPSPGHLLGETGVEIES